MSTSLDTSSRDFQPPRGALVASIYLFVTGSAVFLLLPIFVGALVDSGRLDDAAAGLAASSELLGTAVMSIWSFFWIHRWRWRQTAARMAAVLALVEIASVFVTSGEVFMALRFFAGVAAATLIVIPTALIARLAHSERIFAYVVAAEVAFQALGMVLFPRLIAAQGIFTFFAGLALLAAAAAVAAYRWMPERGPHEDSAPAGLSDSMSKLAAAPLLGLFGTLLYFANIAAVWAFLERIGDAAGLSTSFMGDSLAVSLVMGFGGALLASWLSDRYGQILPIGISTVGQVTALLMLLLPFSDLQFVIAIVLYNFFWNFILPYQMAAVARVDFAQRFVVWIIAFQAIGDAIGPGVAGQLVDGKNYDSVLILAICLLVTSLLFFAPITVRRGRAWLGA